MANTSPVIAVAISDIHLHIWKQYNQENRRFWASYSALEMAVKKANDYKVPLIIAGDLLNADNSCSNELFDLITKFILPLFEKSIMGILCISGNHDMSQQNTGEHSSPSWVRSLSRICPNLICLDNTYKDFILRDTQVRFHGLPYYTHNLGLMENLQKAHANKEGDTNILLTHMDLPGLLDTDGREVGSFENLKKTEVAALFNDFDLVLNGHIHLPQFSDRFNTLTIGTPTQLRKSDSDANLGMWIIRADVSQKFIEFDELPKFKYFKRGTEPWVDEIDRDTNYWIEIPADQVTQENKSPIISMESKSKLAKNYCKIKNIEDKAKVNKLIQVLNHEQ